MLPSQLAEIKRDEKDDSDPFDGDDSKIEEMEEMESIMGGNFIGVRSWNSLGVKIKGDIPPIPWDEETLLSDCPFHPGKTVAETHMLLLLPQSFSERGIQSNQEHEEGLTVLELMRLLAKKGTNNHSDDTNLDKKWYKDTKFANRSASKTKWCLVLKDTVPGSENKTYKKGKEELPPGYKPSNVLTEVVKQKLSSQELSQRHAFCSNTIDGKNVIVSNMQEECILLSGNVDDTNNDLGMSAVRTDG